MILVIGSYTDSLPHVQAKGEGISLLSFDEESGQIAPLSVFRDVRNPTYLAASADRTMLYAVEEISQADGAGVIALDMKVDACELSLAYRLPAHGDFPCHLAADPSGRRFFVSNYGSGNLVAYDLDEAGRPTERFACVQRTGNGPNRDRQEGPHVHQSVVSPDGRHLLICDLGTDEVARHRISSGLIETLPDLVATVGQGTLPRHLVFSPDGRTLHVIHEGANTITSHDYESPDFAQTGEVSLLPPEFAGASAAAAIKLHPQGRFLYASNRGHDSIAAFSLSPDERTLQPIGHFPTGGRAPRDFTIDPTGRWLVAANQDSHCLTVFRIDSETGRLSRCGEPFAIGSPVCVLFA